MKNFPNSLSLYVTACVISFGDNNKDLNLRTLVIVKVKFSGPHYSIQSIH